MPDISKQAKTDGSRVVKVDEPWMGYDYIARIPIKHLALKNKPDQRAFYKKADAVYDLLKRGLADRLVHINIVTPKSHDVDVQNGNLDIGLVSEPNVALRAIDRGPPPEDEAASRAFRETWGPKAELRRFKDGSIQESAVWSGTEARELMVEIITHLVSYHLSDDAADHLVVYGNEFDALLPGFSPKLSLFDPVTAAFRTLDQDIRSLNDLPLSIRQISPASSPISSSSVHLPFAAKGRKSRPMDVVLQFEESSRWPDDLQAIQMTKVAFLLKMNELLAAQKRKVTSQIGLENEHSDILNRTFLEIAYPSGMVFRLRIRHDREQTLLDRILKANDATPADRDAAAAALAAYKRVFVKTPTHCQALQATITRYPPLSGTIRLLKRWFDVHLLGIHFPEEVIEIMCLRSFVHSHPWKPPSSPQTGLLRTLLFLSRWDWQSTPLLVDFDGNATSPELMTASTRFDAFRKIDPAINRVVLFAATNLDVDGNTWTERSPTKVIANRMTSLANAALKSIRQQGVELDMAPLFKPSLKGYDFCIHLNKAFVPPKRAVQTMSKFKNLQQAHAGPDTGTAGFAPVTSFINELIALYGEVVVLFYDPEGGPVIAGIWDPSKTERRWKVNLPYSTKATLKASEDGTATATVNKPAILGEIARLGRDMIESISTKE